jgi:hypothetical protein
MTFFPDPSYYMYVNVSKFEQDIRAGNFKKLLALAKSYLPRSGWQAVISYTAISTIVMLIPRMLLGNWV